MGNLTLEAKRQHRNDYERRWRREHPEVAHARDRAHTAKKYVTPEILWQLEGYATELTARGYVADQERACGLCVEIGTGTPRLKARPARS